MKAQIVGFYDKVTGTISYIVYDQSGGHAAIIDPVLDYDPKSGRTNTESADKLIDYVKQQQLNVEWLLETHAHADHLSAAHYLRARIGGKKAISERIVGVQHIFGDLFNIESTFSRNGAQFDYLLQDEEILAIGKLKLRVISVPGHTTADLAFQIDDAIFLGDTLFMPDVGTARCDFPGGDSHSLYQSIRKILSFPTQTRLYVCHDYPPPGREAMWQSTVAEQLAHNIHIHEGVDEQSFVAMRNARDKTLAMPVLLLPAIQVNIRAGEFPPPEDNEVSYLKIPLNHL